MSALRLDEAALRRVLTGPEGPVYRYMADVDRQIVNLAKVFCPVDTGRLRASIQGSVTVEGANVTSRSGSNVAYAAAIHQGSTRQTRLGVTVRAGRPFLLRAAREVTGLQGLALSP